MNNLRNAQRKYDRAEPADSRTGAATGFGRSERRRDPEEPPEGAHVVRSTKFVQLPKAEAPSNGDQKTART